VLACDQVPGFGRTSHATLASTCLALALVVVWFVYRQSFWAFFLQDTFGICVCCVFLLQIRLPNVKVRIARVWKSVYETHS
jgi:hypothetical protein